MRRECERYDPANYVAVPRWALRVGVSLLLFTMITSMVVVGIEVVRAWS